jgi:alkylation response protein AidB-like acyl-CoA dehydrogenase
MNFDLSEEQQILVESVQRFVQEESGPERFRKLRESERGWEPEMWERMGEMGWLSVPFPEEHGGFGGRFVDLAVIIEQLGRGLVPEPIIASVVLAGGLISRLGSDAQVKQFLAPMIQGKKSLALAYTERQSRYDLADCLTTAEATSGGYVLKGQKTWVLNGHAADHIVVVARTAGGQLNAAGISLFILDAGTPGLFATSAAGMDGQRSALLDLDGVEVPSDRLLGTLGDAHPHLEWAVDRAAAAACAEGLGAVQELFERTVAYLKQREQFGVPIGSFQVLQHRAADMFSETELCRSMMILSAIQADSENAEERAAEISAAKRQLSESGWFVQSNAIQLFGGIGVTDEQDEGLFFKRLRVLQGLFGDADHHVDRFQRLSRFDAEVRAR